MGTIVQAIFDRLGRTGRADRDRAAGDCEIIIFPGVRIERGEAPTGDLLPPGRAPGQRRRKRPRKTA